MKKRLVLCALALVLSLGAMATSSRPAYACTMDPACADEGCDWQCPNGGTCNYCTGRCHCL